MCYFFVRSARLASNFWSLFLDPHRIVFSADGIKVQLTAALDILLDANLLSATTIQSADREYRSLISDPIIREEMKAYSREVRLDDFWMSILSRTSGRENLTKTVKTAAHVIPW